MKDIEQKLSDKIIFRKYKIIKNIGKGSYCTVFLTKNIINQKYFALKIQNKTFKIGNLENEAFYLFQLKHIGIPKIISYGHLGQYIILIEELLGKTLEELFKENKDKPKIIRLKDMLMAGIQIINLIKYIHSRYILHLDIKPHNFLVGNPNNSIIYIIDFGLAKTYRSSRTGKHAQLAQKSFFNGNICFASVNTMKGIEPSRRDDLESIGYMLIYLYTQHLPWNSITAKNKIDLIKKIYEIKNLIPIKLICKNTPNEMNEFMKYVKSLKFEEEPNYNYLINILEDMLKKINKVNDLNFSWISEDLRNNSNKINLLKDKKKKVSPFSKIFNEISSKSEYEVDNKIKSYNISKLMSEDEDNIYFKKEENKTIEPLITNKILRNERAKSEKDKNSVLIKLKNNIKKKTKVIKNIKLTLVNNINKNQTFAYNKNKINITKIVNNTNKTKSFSRNKLLNYKYIIAPNISNKIFNIYLNYRKKSFNNKQFFNNNKSNTIILKNSFLDHNNNNNTYDNLQIKYLLNKYEKEYNNCKYNISGEKNPVFYSFLSPNIVYKRKFNMK